jgi:hypothetical protein
LPPFELGEFDQSGLIGVEQAVFFAIELRELLLELTDFLGPDVVGKRSPLRSPLDVGARSRDLAPSTLILDGEVVVWSSNCRAMRRCWTGSSTGDPADPGNQPEHYAPRARTCASVDGSEGLLPAAFPASLARVEAAGATAAPPHLERADEALPFTGWGEGGTR